MDHACVDLQPGRETPGTIPAGWRAFSPRPDLMPRFVIEDGQGGPYLSAGSSRCFCSGRLERPVVLQGGSAYALRVLVRVPDGINPNRHLIFAVYGIDADFNDGIFHYRRDRDGLALGEAVIVIPGDGPVTCSMRLYYRLGDGPPVQIYRYWLEPCAKPAARPVKVATTRGNVQDLSDWQAAVDQAGNRGLDLMLLPEVFLGNQAYETLTGASAGFLASQAARHGMYLAGGLLLKDPDRQVYNTCCLFDRSGHLAGRYDKHHPYSPEINDQGRMPGTDVPVFRTDFGQVGMLICYDSWFSDVCELLGLKGAEIALFPNAGYYRSLMPARANDNGMYMVASSLYDPVGIWDPAGRDIEAPDADATHNANSTGGFTDISRETVGKIEILYATIDLSVRPSAHNWGGSLLSSPGGRRNRRDEWASLAGAIAAEQERWLDE